MASKLGPGLGIIGQIIGGLDRSFTGFSEVVDAFVEAAQTAHDQLQDFEKFDFDPRFKTRVISVPRAIDGAQELWDKVRHGLIDKLSEIIQSTKDIAAALKNIPPRAPGEPLLQHTALVLEFIHAFNSNLARLVGEVLDFTGTIDSIKNRIETLDDLFLPQSNPQVKVDAISRKRQRS